jgi:hypothetical protein
MKHVTYGLFLVSERQNIEGVSSSWFGDLIDAIQQTIAGEAM